MTIKLIDLADLVQAGETARIFTPFPVATAAEFRNGICGLQDETLLKLSNALQTMYSVIRVLATQSITLKAN